MPPFKTVSGGRAGPRALGILVPPANRTVVVVRPRSLAIDLVVVARRPDGSWGEGFLELDRAQAGLEAQKLSRALHRWAEGGPGCLAMDHASAAEGWWVRVDVDAIRLLVCPRLPGEAYRPLTYDKPADAQTVLDDLRLILCPDADANQELYTNLSQFGRSPSGRG